jgi:hypothetical protein
MKFFGVKVWNDYGESLFTIYSFSLIIEDKEHRFLLTFQASRKQK